ncbi:MAG: M1 family metallopeptidase [Flavobacteriales bacterium]|nr:M1 family metallopeptidase [Flavobacteriales bacterium]
MAISVVSCSVEEKKQKEEKVMYSEDPHSFSKPNEAVVKHLSLDISLDFDTKIINGVALYKIERKTADSIVFDVKGLTINKVFLNYGKATTFEIKKGDINGDALVIKIDESTTEVGIDYTTGKGALALQWLALEQTGGKETPYLFTQGQAILTRTWIPCQDSPGIRISYDAKVKVPVGMMAVMSADNGQEKNATGEYTFDMDIPIPCYLIALAVGDIEFKAIGPRTGVYCEPYLLEESAYEFGDMERMLTVTEEMYGPYPWGRYDVIVLPPSFPFGGMENPKLTFATPTIIAGDRSLTALIAHEMAHSWSGNLVTNATWSHIWVNEGFTVYLEQRIMEEMYGREYSEMLASLSLQEVMEEIEEMGQDNPDTRLEIDLAGRNPDDGFSGVPYNKGYLMLRKMEETYGRELFDEFLKGYFKTYQFKSITTQLFEEYLADSLFSQSDIKFNTDEWIHKPGMPASVSVIESDKFLNVEVVMYEFVKGIDASEIETKDWSTHEWLHFITNLPNDLTRAQMSNLDDVFNLTKSSNSEILSAWLIYSVANNYEVAFESAEQFLINVGRRKFLTPLYKKLIETDENHPGLAASIYAKARSNYHAVSYETLDKLFEKQ